MTDRVGVPLSSGFRFRPAEDVLEAQLSDEAKARVQEKWAEFDRSQRRAWAAASRAVIG